MITNAILPGESSNGHWCWSLFPPPRATSGIFRECTEYAAMLLEAVSRPQQSQANGEVAQIHRMRAVTLARLMWIARSICVRQLSAP